jgi:outer membrane biosynthesis protein TonB
MSDKDKVLDICRRIERALQRDWGSTGTGLSQRLRTTRYAVPPELLKRIHFLRRLQKQALHKERFKLKSPADFEAKGDQVLEELAVARKTAARRLKPWLADLALRYRVIVGTAAVALLLAVAGVLYLLREPEPVLPPVALPTPAPRPAPRPAPKPVPKPAAVATPAPAPAVPASAAQAVVPAAPASAPAPVAAAEPAPMPADTQVHIEAPSQVTVTLKRVEVVKGTSDRDEIAVIVDVQNMGYASLKRITFDAWLYDTAGARPVARITPSEADTSPWHAFLRLALKRGQSAEVRLSYSTTSRWSAEQAIALVNSGRYQIRLKAVSLTDEANQSLPLTLQ